MLVSCPFYVMPSEVDHNLTDQKVQLLTIGYKKLQWFSSEKKSPSFNSKNILSCTAFDI